MDRIKVISCNQMTIDTRVEEWCEHMNNSKTVEGFRIKSTSIAIDDNMVTISITYSVDYIRTSNG